MHTTKKSCFMRLSVLLLMGFMLTIPTVQSFADDETGDDAPLFFPALPQEPRLQFLTKYSSALDVSTERKGFRDFVFGGEDKEAQIVQKPYGLAVYDGAIFVVDTRGNGYAKFDLAAGRARFVKPSGAGRLVKPINITIDEDGNRFVTDTDREQILVYNSNDRFVRAIGGPGQFRPTDIAISGDRLYITDIKHHQVHVLDKQTDEVLLTFSEAGSEEGQLFHPTNLTIAPDGTIYVTDTSNFRIQQFDADGEFIRVIGGPGVGYGAFSRPKGIALDRDENIYVVDAAFQNVQILAPDTTPLLAFGRAGPERWNTNLPTVVKIDYDNVSYFEKYAAPNFELEYLVFVANQFGLAKVVVFGFGELRE
jgi:DNA-binding beta-propeller fold protein YncE